jgi:hypothetical protein
MDAVYDETTILKSIKHTEPETLKEAIKAMMETASNCLLKGESPALTGWALLLLIHFFCECHTAVPHMVKNKTKKNCCMLVFNVILVVSLMTVAAL